MRLFFATGKVWPSLEEPAVERIRVLVSGPQGLSRDIVVREISSATDMEIVGYLPYTTELLGAESVAADVVVIMVQDAADDTVDSHLAHAFPTRAVVAVNARGYSTRAVVAVDTRGYSIWSFDWALHRSARIAGDLTPGTVVEAIRAAAQRTGVGVELRSQ